MHISKIAAYVVTVAASVTGILTATAVSDNAPKADAQPMIEPVVHYGPVNSYAMSDDASCFIDYTTWIDRDPAQPARVVGHIRPLNTRATIPGLPAPAHCSVTLVDTTLTDLDILGHPTAPGGPDAPMFGLLGEAVHIDSGPAGGAAAEVTLPYQPNASAVAVRFMPQAMLYPIFGAYVAQPLIGPSTAFDLH